MTLESRILAVIIIPKGLLNGLPAADSKAVMFMGQPMTSVIKQLKILSITTTIITHYFTCSASIPRAFILNIMAKNAVLFRPTKVRLLQSYWPKTPRLGNARAGFEMA